MAKGDKVVVTVDYGAGVVAAVTVEADAAGRTVQWDRDRKTGEVLVEVNGRAGTLVRKHMFRADRVIAVEEVPA